ncbi:MAG: sodium:proton antiporter [Rhizobiales bacterium]|nr:sodium:proton antiporter [Hyphomicrobiales bacterium]
MTEFEIAALLLTLSALFGWFNIRFFRLPHTIGLLIMALSSSLALLVLHAVFPAMGLVDALRDLLNEIDFYSALMEGMLSLLLFAGALHVDLNLLKDQKWVIGIMASIGVAISTAIVGVLLWAAARLCGFDVPLAWALVFGALISPTDPVAVLGLLKTVSVPETIKAKIAGESLFNDGAALVMFTVLITLAMVTPAQQPPTAFGIAQILVYEGVGSILFGLLTGWIAYRGMLAIDDHVVEILISLAVCVGTYVLCHRLHLSGPIAVAVCGLFIGNHGAEYAMSEKVEEYLFAFWEVVDELLNSVLFLLIGLEVLVIAFDLSLFWFALLAIPIVLLARWVSVAVPISLLSMRKAFSRGAIPILTWGGLRGGVSVALALTLPDEGPKALLQAATYGVVIFSIVFQGLTIKWVIGRTTDVPVADG